MLEDRKNYSKLYVWRRKLSMKLFKLWLVINVHIPFPLEALCVSHNWVFVFREGFALILRKKGQTSERFNQYRNVLPNEVCQLLNGTKTFIESMRSAELNLRPTWIITLPYWLTTGRGEWQAPARSITHTPRWRLVTSLWSNTCKWR